MVRDRLISAVLTAKDEFWESGLELPQYEKPSRALRRVMYSRPHGLSPQAGTYFSRYDDRTRVEVGPLDLHPLPWKVESDRVVDANGRAVFTEPHGYEGKWKRVADMVVEAVSGKKT